MSTALVLSNNRLLVNIDYNLQLCDLYFPFIGQDNQLNKNINKMFLMIDGELIQINSENCRIDLDYADKACIGEMVLVINKFKIECRITDLVLHDRDIYLRDFTIINNDAVVHDVRLYFQNNFALNESVFANTAVWYQPAGCLLHYAKEVYLGVGSTRKLYQFTCAAKSDYDNKGAFPKVDGELPFNPVATGDVSSCLSFKFDLQPQQSVKSDYYIVAAKSLEQIEPLVKYLASMDFADIRQRNASYWHDRLAPLLLQENSIRLKLQAKAGKEFALKTFNLYWKSLLILLTQIDQNGAVIAANDGQFLKSGGTDSYSYFWPRDGANAVMALTEAGLQAEAQRVLAYALNVSGNKGFFWHKYFPGSREQQINIGSSWHPWIDHTGSLQLPIQEDATALMILALVKYYQKFSDTAFILKHWHKIEASLKFLKSYNLKKVSVKTKATEFVTGFSWENGQEQKFPISALPKPSYDIWEQYYGVFTYTAVTVLEAIRSGIELTDIAKAIYLKDDLIVYVKELSRTILTDLYDHRNNLLLKGIRLETETGKIITDASTDASLLFAATLSADPALSPLLNAAVIQMDTKLKINNFIGGWARKEADLYLLVKQTYPGNPWALTMLWLAQNHLKTNELDLAIQDLTWVNNHADPAGLLAEQYNPETGFSVGMKPLTWSHAEYLKTVAQLLKKL